MRVLIIDDSAVMRKIVKAALRHSGFQLDCRVRTSHGLGRRLADHDAGPVIDDKADSMETLTQQMDGAVTEVFERMLERGCAAMPEACAIEVAISARILFSGAAEAQCVLEFPLSSAHRLTDAFLGTADADWDESTIADSVGELCNMIAGGSKKRLGASAWGVDLSTPLLLRGSSDTTPQVPSATLCRVYVFDESRFAVRVAVFQVANELSPVELRS